MNINECNKIIAEYMGYTWISGRLYNGFYLVEGAKRLRIPDSAVSYSTSLDALVPVWEKLKERWRVSGIFEKFNSTIWCVCLERKRYEGEPDEVFADGKTIQEAAAIATAKAIQELRK